MVLWTEETAHAETWRQEQAWSIQGAAWSSLLGMAGHVARLEGKRVSWG